MNLPGTGKVLFGGWSEVIHRPVHLLVRRLLVVLAVAVTAGCELTGSGATPTPSLRRTGFTVDPLFQSFYRDNGGQRVFGYPISPAFIEGEDGSLIQYFQQMRLEFDTSEGEIVLAPLGEWAVPDPADQVPAPGLNQGGLAISGTSLTVQDEFLTFYESYNGPEILGKPITPQLDEGGRRVQYFRNGRLEWRPDARLGYRVQVGPLGEAHYRQVGYFEDPGRNRAVEPAPFDEVRVSTAVSRPILYQGDDQVIFVKVETPEGGRPVKGVSLALNVMFGDKTETIALDDTGDDGFTRRRLALEKAEPGQTVRLLVTATGPDGTTIGAGSHSFKVWW